MTEPILDVCWACGLGMTYVTERQIRDIHLSSHMHACLEYKIMAHLIDLSTDDVKRWTFKEVGPWRFAWKPGLGIIFVYAKRHHPHPMSAFPIGVLGSEATHEQAVAASKEYIRSRPTYDTPAWDPWWERPVSTNRSFGLEKSSRKAQWRPTGSLQQSRGQMQAQALRDKAVVLAAALDLTQEDAELRLRIMVGDYRSDYEEQIDEAFRELLMISARPGGEQVIEEKKTEFVSAYTGAPEENNDPPPPPGPEFLF